MYVLAYQLGYERELRLVMPSGNLLVCVCGYGLVLL